MLSSDATCIRCANATLGNAIYHARYRMLPFLHAQAPTEIAASVFGNETAGFDLGTLINPSDAIAWRERGAVHTYALLGYDCAVIEGRKALGRL